MAATGNGVHISLQELLIPRAALARQSTPARLTVRGSSAGDSRSRNRGRGIEFDEVRPYQAGDDIRAIDWRASARLGRTFTKLFCEEREENSFIAVDQRASMFFGSRDTFKSVTAAKVAALACWSALARGERVGGLVAGELVEVVRARRDRRAVLHLLDTLVTSNHALCARSPAGVSLEHMLDECLTHSQRGTTVVIVSDFADYEVPLNTVLRSLARGRKLSLIRITDPLEMTMAINGRVGVSNGRERGTVRLSSRQRQQYLADRNARAESLRAEAVGCGASLRDVST